MKYFMLRDGYDVYFKENEVENPKGVIVITHGFAEHYSRYDYVANSFNNAGYAVIRYDLRGHGRNKEDIGHIESFNSFVEDLHEIINWTREKYKDIGVFTLGHSMGGLITGLYGIKYKDSVKGQVFSGAALGTLPSAEKQNRSLLKILKSVAKKITIKNPVDEAICTNKQVYIDYINDEFVLKKATISFYYEFLFAAVDTLNAGIKSYSLPCLITHGEKDRIVPPALSQNFYNKISSKDKELIFYKELYHEILNENEKDQIISDMVQWLNKHN